MAKASFCYHCKFWQLRPERGMGECHRNAPISTVPHDGNYGDSERAKWPLTMKDDWCGQWVEKIKEDAHDGTG